MDLKQLDIFCKIVERGSFSKAAEAAFLSQPTVSFQIQSLEGELGLELFDRSGRSAVLTKSGELFYEYAKRMLALDEEARRALQELQGLSRGEILIGASAIPGEYMLPPVISTFNGAYPFVKTILKVAPTFAIFEKVLDKTIEVGVVGTKLNHGKLNFEELATDKLVLIVPAGHRWSEVEAVDLEELKEEPFILREEGSGTWATWKKYLKKRGLSLAELKVVVELGSVEALKRGVIAGLGVSVIAEKAVEEEVDRGLIKVVPIKDLEMYQTFYIVSNKYRTPSTACNKFLEFLRGQ